MRHYYSAMLVVVGCGGDGGAVTLTVTRNGGPVAGVHTYFLNADNSYVATLDTDTTGTASANMAAGGSVTAIDRGDGPYRVPGAVLGRGCAGAERPAASQVSCRFSRRGFTPRVR